MKIENDILHKLVELVTIEKKSVHELSIRFNIPGKTITRNLIEVGLKEIMRYNNRLYKSTILKQMHLNKRENKLQNLFKLHGNRILDMVDGNISKSALSKELNVCLSTLHQYLIYYNLYKRFKYNSVERLKELSRINGKQNIGGYELKKITPEIEKEYIFLKESGKFQKDISNILGLKYNLKDKKIAQLFKKFGKPVRNDCRGERNSMYGKSSPRNSGIGISGRLIYAGYNINFRSSLELKIFLYLISNDIKFVLSKHRIKYTMNNIQRTYNPDICINNIIYEIKPEKLIPRKEVQVKYEALLKYCDMYNLQCDFITENTYDISNIKRELISELYSKGNLIIFNNKRRPNAYNKLVEVFND